MKNLPAIAIGFAGVCAVLSVAAYMVVGTGEIAGTRDAGAGGDARGATWNSRDGGRGGEGADIDFAEAAVNVSSRRATGGAGAFQRETVIVSATQVGPGAVRRSSVARSEEPTESGDSVRVPIMPTRGVAESRNVVVSERHLIVRSQFGTAAEGTAESAVTEAASASTGSGKGASPAMGTISTNTSAKHPSSAAEDKKPPGVTSTTPERGPAFSAAKANARPSWNQSPLTYEEHLYRAQVGRRAFANEVTEATLNASAQAPAR